MEEINKTTNKNLASGKKKNGLALASISLGLVSLILVILELGPLHSLPLITGFLIFVVPASAVICGIIALIRKPDKFFSLMGVLFGIFVLFYAQTVFFPRGTQPSHAAGAKGDLAGLRAGIAICCHTNGELRVTVGSDICNPEIGTILPGHNELFWAANAADISYTVTSQCDTVTPTITVTIQNHRKKECNGAWTFTEQKMIPPPGC